jgi:hypothetical protein
MRAKRRILLGAAVISTAFVVWVVVSLQNEGSTLNVMAGYVKRTMCWPANSSAVCMLKTMAKYEKKGRYDDAVRTGVEVAEKYPDSVTSQWIYEDLSALYLRRARTDSGHADEYLRQAVIYRDKAFVPASASDSPYSLESVATISESVGDLSTSQRCVQYGDSIKLLGRMKVLANEDEDRLKRQFKTDLAERTKIEGLLKGIDSSMDRVSGKLSASGC